jgi:hypothetical protein
VRGHDFTLPSLRIALLQASMAAGNWLLMACALYTLLDHALAFPLVLGVLFVAAVAGLIVRVPAGLGVLEGVFFIFLGHHMPRGELLAGLLAYRAIYYVAPLLFAAMLYPLLEVHAGKTQAET